MGRKVTASAAAAAPTAPPAGGYLAELAGGWPVGARVRHVDSGWVGTVTGDTCGQAPAIAIGSAPAHGLLFGPPYCGGDVPAVVCVAWDRRKSAPPAWMRLGRLERLTDPPHNAQDQAHDDRENRAEGHRDGDARDGVAGSSRRRRVRGRRAGVIR